MSSILEGQQKMYCVRISSRYQGYDSETLKFIFTPFYCHDVWEDVRSIFFQSIQAFSPLEKDEVPIVFVGASMQNRLTRNREGFGFLVTDQVIYVKEVNMFGENQSKVFPLILSDNITESSLQVVKKAVRGFDWHSLDTLADERTQESLQAFLMDVVLDVLSMKREFDIKHIERLKATNIQGRMSELGLNRDYCIKFGFDEKHVKHLKKVMKKFNIPAEESILLALTDATLAGPYGMAITEKGVYSKDLMEKPVRTERERITRDYPIRIEGNQVVVGTGQAHVLPSTLKDSDKNNIKVLLIELLAGELTV